MRVLIAPDSFGQTLSAQAACQAIATGWHLGAAHDELTLLPLSDGGPGFLSAISALPTAIIRKVQVHSPLGDQVAAEICQLGETVYLESAQACGRDLIADSNSTGVRQGTTFGVGELILQALEIDGVNKIVIGLGGSGTNDGGAGMLAALGSEPMQPLSGGGVGLIDLSFVDLLDARKRIAEVELVIATDVDNPLLGPQGASEVYAPQKGANSTVVSELESGLAHFASLADLNLANVAGAGAAGGLGFGLLLLGARRVSGIEMIAEALDLAGAINSADLVITGEGSFDWQSLRGKVVSGVAHFAAKYGKPVVVIAGQVHVARREFMALGVESAYPVGETPAEIEASLADPEGSLIRRTESVARTWSPTPRYSE